MPPSLPVRADLANSGIHPPPLSLAEMLALYLRYSPDLSKSRRKNLEAAIRRWSEFGGPDDARSITTGHYADFRRFESARGFSPVTIENHVNCFRAMLRHVGPVTDTCPHGLGLLDASPWVGKRLQRRPQVKPAVPLEHLSAVYSVADLSHIPCRRIHPTLFWRAYLVIAYHTGLRAADLLSSLTWNNYDPANRKLVAVAAKTGKRHTFAVNAVFTKHLAMLPRVEDRILPYAAGDSRIRGELARLCALAGVPKFTPQSIRRRAATEYERVHPGSGALLLGHILPSMSMTWQHYIDPVEVLSIAANKLAQPAAFLGVTTPEAAQERRAA